MVTILWLAGTHRADADAITGAPRWEVIGVFDTEARAVASCKSYQDFVAPIALNEVAASETIPFPDSYFPVGTDSEGGVSTS